MPLAVAIPTSRLPGAVEELVTDGVASGIVAQDATLWGPRPRTRPANRLAWVGLAQESRPLVGEIVGAA